MKHCMSQHVNVTRASTFLVLVFNYATYISNTVCANNNTQSTQVASSLNEIFQYV